MTYRAPTKPPPDRERRERAVIRMPESPEEQERRERDERAALARAESRELAAALDAERARFDRSLRLAGLALSVTGLFLASLAPLTDRAALLAGVALVAGPAVTLLGGQGATRPENVPRWVGAIYVAAAFVGGILGLAWLG